MAECPYCHGEPGCGCWCHKSPTQSNGMADTRSPIERMIDEACGVPADFRGTPTDGTPKSQHKAGDWVFYGEYDPGNHPGCIPKSHVFSVGVFQLVPKSRGKGLKRGPVVKRFTGLTARPEEVYARVLKFIAERKENRNA